MTIERLVLSDLEMTYESEADSSFAALRGISLSPPSGGVTAILGPSGCGKTTLLRVIAGFEVPRAGTVSLGGRLLSSDTEWVPPEERRIGLVFQQGALFPHLTVSGNVAYGLKAPAPNDPALPGAARRGVSRKARLEHTRAQVAECLRKVGLSDLDDRYPEELSGGQQQRVAVARALASQPDLILLDEPFASLDAETRPRVRAEVLRALRESGTTVLLVTHDQEEALSCADYVVVMRHGQIVQEGRPQEIYREPVDLETGQFVGGGSVLEASWNGDRLESPVGTLPLEWLETGSRRELGTTQAGLQVRFFCRPEDLILQAVDEGAPGGREGFSGVLISTEFYGHDRIDEVALRDGLTLRVRSLGPGVAAQVGTSVDVFVRDGALRLLS